MQLTGKLRVTELFWDVPLDYDRPTEATIRLFGRAVRRREPGVDLPRDEKVLPWFLYLQGGPGMPSPAPQDVGWVQMVLDRGYQVWEDLDGKCCSFHFWRTSVAGVNINE